MQTGKTRFGRLRSRCKRPITQGVWNDGRRQSSMSVERHRLLGTEGRAGAALVSARHRTWAVVLAGGDGTRLATLTTDGRGDAVPKQFCSLDGGPSLLYEALERAQRIVPPERVCTIVARRHERHWRYLLRALQPRNVIVEPRNCGTANGVLHGLLRILERDRRARTVFLPADHYVHDEALLADSVRAAFRFGSRGRDDITLIGIEPDEVDPELGYIVPGGPLDDSTHRVAEFVEKPAAATARELVARGAVWNSFIFAARATTLLALIRRRMPEIVRDMTAALTRDRRRAARARALDELYEHLPVLDFSRTVVQGAESILRVSTAPACGWTDLGTPRRVAQLLQRLRRDPDARSRLGTAPVPASVDLAAKLALQPYAVPTDNERKVSTTVSSSASVL
jgi:mannose-1-phosphate guanylyltransferase